MITIYAKNILLFLIFSFILYSFYPIVFPAFAQISVDNSISTSTILTTKQLDFIKLQQDSFFQRNATYQQVLESDNLGYVINVYESPKGFGYQIVYDTPTKQQYTGFGPLSSDYTFSIPFTTKISSSSFNFKP